MTNITYYSNKKDFKPREELLIQIFAIYEECKVKSLCTSHYYLWLSCSTSALLVSLLLITSPRQFRSRTLLSNRMALWLPHYLSTLLPLLKTIFRLFVVGNNTSSSDSGCLFSRDLIHPGQCGCVWAQLHFCGLEHIEFTMKLHLKIGKCLNTRAFMSYGIYAPWACVDQHENSS